MCKNGKPPLVKGDACFVCGQSNPDGLRLKFDIDPDRHRAFSSMKIPARYQGWDDITHGGFIATLLDEVCVHAAKTFGSLPVTAELTVSFKKPVGLETEVFLIAEAEKKSGRLVESRGRLEIAGVVHAEATAKVVLMKN